MTDPADDSAAPDAVPPAPAGRAARYRRRIFGGAGVLLVTAPLLLWALAPYWTTQLAPRLAAPLGLDRLEVALQRPGLRTLDIDRIDLVRGPVRLHAADIRLQYRIADLVRGRLQRATLLALDVEVDRGSAAVEARPESRVREQGAAPDVDPPADPPEPGFPLTPRQLFAMLPLRALEVTTLTLRVPGQAFVGRGTLALADGIIEARIDGLAPQPASRFTLDLHLAESGDVRFAVGDNAQPQTPFVAVTSNLQAHAGHAELDLRVDLHGYALALASELLGAPAGEGRITADLTTRLRWPASAIPDWRELAAHGTVDMVWRPAGAPDIELGPLSGRWTVLDGRLETGIAGRISRAGQLFHVTFDVAAEDPGQGIPTGRGTGRILLEDVASGSVDVDAAFSEAGLALVLAVDLQDPALRLLLREAGMPEGTGTLAGTIRVALPDLPTAPAGVDWGAVDAEADLLLQLHMMEPDVSLTPLRAVAHWRNRELRGELAGVVGYGGERFGSTLELARLVHGAGGWSAAGALGVNALQRIPFTLQVAPDAGSAVLGIRHEFRIDAPLLAGVWPARAGSFDLDRGTVDIDAGLHWRAPDQVAGSLRAILTDVSAHFEDYRFDGIAATAALNAGVDGWRLAPAPFRVDVIDAGVRLRTVTGEVGWSGDTVSVRGLQGEVLGGRFSAAPIDYRISSGAAGFEVDLTGLSLAELFALQGDQVRGDGTLDGRIPVRLDDDTPSVRGGRLEARPPGGHIRLSRVAGGSAQPDLDFALRALEDFRYTRLIADVDYSPAGELSLGVQLHGHNPAIEAGRPIHYNVTVRENIPVLLESLRLQDRFTDALEQRLRN